MLLLAGPLVALAVPAGRPDGISNIAAVPVLAPTNAAPIKLAADSAWLAKPPTHRWPAAENALLELRTPPLELRTPPPPSTPPPPNPAGTLLPYPAPPPPPVPAPSLPPVPETPCEKFEYLAKYKPDMDEAELVELRAMAKLLCEKLQPCPEPSFSDPQDVCTMCKGVLPPPSESALSLSACLATVDWACSICTTDSYPFCSAWPEGGYKVDAVSPEDVSDVTKWWEDNCPDRVSQTEQYAGVQARQQALQAQGAAT